MSIFQKIISTDSFLDWLTAWNLFADSASPLGTGTIEFANINITGVITIGSSSSALTKSIPFYDYDLVTPPKETIINNRICSDFSGTKTCTIWFNFDMADLQILGSDRKIGLGYSIETTGTGNSYWKTSYWINKQNQAFLSTASGTSFNEIEITGTSASMFYKNSITIPSADVSDSSWNLFVKLERLGSDVLDTYENSIYLHNINIE